MTSEKRFEKVTPFAVNDTWDNHRPIECASSLDADVVCHYLNEQQDLIEELRLQEKEKGVPVFVVRDGKNPVALFFNEQRAMYYCQENMAHLTYQQEKWCRVE